MAMRLKSHVSLLGPSLRRHVLLPARPLLSSSLQCTAIRPHRYASTQKAGTTLDESQESSVFPNSVKGPEKIAILGGGISGLSSAYYFSKFFPETKITIYEAQKEVGGWIKSRRVDVPGGGSVVFEQGPRTLRTGINALPVAEMIEELDLASEVITTSKDTPGAQGRYIYYPDRLNKMPTTAQSLLTVNGLWDLFSLWSSGLLDGILSIRRNKAIWDTQEFKRKENMVDESIGAFVSRHSDKRIADNLVSAVFHGIHAGDIYKLSARTLLSRFWHNERRYSKLFHRDTSNLDTGVLQPEKAGVYTHPVEAETLDDMVREIRLGEEMKEKLNPHTQAMFSFRDGLQTLPRALEAHLRENENVQFLTDHRVDSIGGVDIANVFNVDEKTTTSPSSPTSPTSFNSDIEITTTSNNEPSSSSHNLIVSTLPAPTLAPPVTLMTVNLYYTTPHLVPVSGFGYLIPRSIPFEQNPERALGVIFDHDTVAGQDSVAGTKLTVMLGGHWWDDWVCYPTEEEGLELAQSLAARHLRITEKPDVWQVNLHKNAIPQFTVGYDGRLAAAGAKMEKWRGKMHATGNSYGAVGVNDCVKDAWRLASCVRDEWIKEERGEEARRVCSPGFRRVGDGREWGGMVAKRWA